MLDFIIKTYQQRLLHNILKTQRDKRIENWEYIHSIGLVFIVGDSEQWNLINKFITTQKKQNKEIHIIGLHKKDYQIDYIFTHTDTIICHEKEDLNFFGIPKNEIINNFRKRHFDLLIDATQQPCFFGKYITTVTEADLKVGYSNSEATDEGLMEMYDLTIQGNQEMDFKDYIEQTVKYLAMIHK